MDARHCRILSGEANKTAEDFRKFVNKEVLPELEALATDDFNPFKGLRARLEEQEAKDGEPPEPPKRVISPSTATAWLKKLGCEYHGGKNGRYFDGHDDPDTIKYRNNELLRNYGRFATTWMCCFQSRTRKRLTEALL